MNRSRDSLPLCIVDRLINRTLGLQKPSAFASWFAACRCSRPLHRHRRFCIHSCHDTMCQNCRSDGLGLIKDALLYSMPVVDLTEDARGSLKARPWSYRRWTTGQAWAGKGTRNLDIYSESLMRFALLHATHEVLPNRSISCIRYRLEKFGVRAMDMAYFLRNTAPHCEHAWV
jgi:hypothetical protein